MLPKNDTINKKSNFSLVVDCEGVAKPLYTIIYIKILVFIGIESKEGNDTYMITCSDEMNFKTELPKNYNIDCTFNFTTTDMNITYDKIYLYPYSSYLHEADQFYEVIILKTLEGVRIDNDKNEKDYNTEHINTGNINIDNISDNYGNDKTDFDDNEDDIIIISSAYLLLFSKTTVLIMILES